MDRVILITGATGRIGRVFVKYFLNQGDEVIALARTKKNLTKLAKDNKEFNERIHLINLDLMSNKFCEKLINFLIERNLNPTSLVNNARSLENLKNLDPNFISEESFLTEYKLAVIIPYQLISILSELKNSKLSNVVNISSIYGNVVPHLNLYDSLNEIPPIHYGLAKASSIKLTKELAVRLSKKKINVNCISYGGIEGRVDNNFIKKYSYLCPSGKMLSDEDLCHPLDSLLSNKNNSINGQNIMIDGGWTLW